MVWRDNARVNGDTRDHAPAKGPLGVATHELRAYDAVVQIYKHGCVGARLEVADRVCSACSDV